MQNEQLIRDTEPAIAIEIQRARKTLPSLSLAEVWACHRKMRIALSLPRRQTCLTRHAMIAALRETELAELATRQAVDRKSASTHLNDTSVWLRALRSPEASGENLIWVVLALATTLSLAIGFGAMGGFVEKWTEFANLMARCLG
jgi:hypothetical protein